MTKLIELDALQTEGFQTRDGLSAAVVREYEELMRGGTHLPPLSVVEDAAGTRYLVDGYHRLAALRRLGRNVGDAEIVPGERADALRAALKANAAHGLRRTNADIRNALELAWHNRLALFGGDPSHEMLAAACAVSRSTARRFRERLTGVLTEHPCARIGQDGKSYTPPSEAAATTPAADADGEAARRDRFGRLIPESLARAFGSARYAAFERAAQALRTELRAAQKDGDLAFAKVSQATGITLSNLIGDLKTERPYCVCPQCQGRGCRACGTLGFQTHVEYARNPAELRAPAGAPADARACAGAHARVYI